MLQSISPTLIYPSRMLSMQFTSPTNERYYSSLLSSSTITSLRTNIESLLANILAIKKEISPFESILTSLLLWMLREGRI